MPPLLTLHTDRVRLTWTGPPAEGGGRLVVRALGAGAVHVEGAGAGPEAEVPVAFQEETAYLVLLQSLSGEPVALDHRDPVVGAGLVAADGGRVVHGPVRFGSQAGRSRFVVRVGGRAEVEIALDVRPTKLDWADVQAMRAAVEEAAAGLAVAALRPAAVGVAPEGDEPSPAVWLARLAAAADRLATALAAIDRHPVLETHRPLASVRSERVRRASAETRRAVAREGGGNPARLGRLPARPPGLSADTPAHRWLAARLRAVQTRVQALARAEARRSPSARRGVIIREAEALARGLGALRRTPALRDAGDRAPASPPLVLRRAPAYAAAYAALRDLDRGLALREGALDVATQDLAVLYETWAALTVVATAAEVLGVEPPPRPFGVDVVGTDVRLRRGARGAVRLAAAHAEVEIVYNPRFPAPPALLVQRPDLVLTVRAPGRPPRRLVLDAKYRRDDSAGYVRRHGAAGPPEDALGTLHRYRDAIVGPERQPGWVGTAVALFPGTPDAAFEASRLWTSLETLGVGAVPLRPGHDGALRTFLAGVLSAG